MLLLLLLVVVVVVVVLPRLLKLLLSLSLFELKLFSGFMFNSVISIYFILFGETLFCSFLLLSLFLLLSSLKFLSLLILLESLPEIFEL